MINEYVIDPFKEDWYFCSLWVRLLKSPWSLCPIVYCACNFLACSHGVLKELVAPQTVLFWLNQESSWRSTEFQYGWALLRAFYISSSPNLDFWWIEGSFWCLGYTLWCSGVPRGIAQERTKTTWSYCHCCCLWMSASIVSAQFCNFIRGYPCRTCTKTLWSKVKPCFSQTGAPQAVASISQKMFLCSKVLWQVYVDARDSDRKSQKTCHGCTP